MRNVGKLHIYFTTIIVTLFVFYYVPNNWKKLIGLLLLILLCGGWAVSVKFIHAFEHAVAQIPDREKCRGILNSSGISILKKMAVQQEILALKMEKKYSVKVEDKQSKINSLQSQINPHFLYNTLECIRSEAVCQGNKSIANMAKSLASFFRYSISRKENIVTLQDELNNIRNYILIQNYRFEDKFQFSVKIDEEDQKALVCQIPKMTMQPIVENSIFHGLETKAGDCCVTIYIRMTQDKVLLTISDNGVGMNEKQLERLQYGLEYGAAEEMSDEQNSVKKTHGNGIALFNINQRLKLTFGEEYYIKIYSIEGEGTDVEILLPISTEKDKR